MSQLRARSALFGHLNLEHPMAPAGGVRQPPVRVEQWRKGVEMGCLSNAAVSNQPHLVPTTMTYEVIVASTTATCEVDSHLRKLIKTVRVS